MSQRHSLGQSLEDVRPVELHFFDALKDVIRGPGKRKWEGSEDKENPELLFDVYI